MQAAQAIATSNKPAAPAVITIPPAFDVVAGPVAEVDDVEVEGTIEGVRDWTKQSSPKPPGAE